MDKSFQIISNQTLVDSTLMYLLKLNKEQSTLDVYKNKSIHLDDKQLKELLLPKYPIREDLYFDHYTVYQLEQSLPCIHGSDCTPTIEGVCTINNKSYDKYISNYYKGGPVCFFGYLEIFEDYFIHSHLYKEDETFDNKGKSISLDDKSTSGCIRVSEEHLKWLLDNIDVHTMIIL